MNTESYWQKPEGKRPKETGHFCIQDAVPNRLSHTMRSVETGSCEKLSGHRRCQVTGDFTELYDEKLRNL
jgi:hypothetical protein